jgi:phosphoglycolate phosphatase-like HAD superfamily hydrolase
VQPAPQTRQIFVRPGFDPFAASAYLFDIDGTLLNTRDGVHWNAFRTALREVFAIESLLDTVPMHGNTDIGILRAVTEQHGLSRENFERHLPRALAIMRDEVEQNCTNMQCDRCPGIDQLLDELRRRGKVLGIVSGNLESIGRKKIAAAGLSEFFSFGSFSDQVEQRTEIFRAGLHMAGQLVLQSPHHQITQSLNPLSSRACHCIFVGDTPADVAAAQALGTPVIAVATGIYDFAELLASSPDACVPCCTDLPVAGGERWQRD